MELAKSVEEYIAKSGEWAEVVERLREILLSTELDEDLKWGAPAYLYEGKNLIGLGAFKSYAGIWFHQGALLSDPKKKLINAQEGVTRALRQWRFSSLDDVNSNETLIGDYIKEAIRNHLDGKEIKPQKKKPLNIPNELKVAFSDNAQLKKSFDSLNLTRQREFADHIATAKREETRLSRLEKIIPMILEGKGLNDKYRK